MADARKLTLLVSSSVYGIEELLERIYALLTAFGYEVWMSHKGTMPVFPDRSAFENCLAAVETCDLFLGLAREDEPLYPAEAVREGLVNAFAHRDYADYKGGVAVHVYPRRLEIWNSGSLPEGVTLDTLAKGHISVLRNPDIAHVLYLRGMMEKVGRGSLLVLNACRNRELPAPVWSTDALGVTLTFHALQVTGEVAGEDADQVTGQVAGHVADQVTGEVERLLRVLRDHVLTRAEIQERLGLKGLANLRDRYLVPALETGLVEMTVPGKPRSRNQHYRVSSKGAEVLETLRARERGES